MCNRLVFFLGFFLTLSFNFRFSVSTTCSCMHWRRYFYRFCTYIIDRSHFKTSVKFESLALKTIHAHSAHKLHGSREKRLKSLAAWHATYAMFRLWICRIVRSLAFLLLQRLFFSISFFPSMFVNLVYDWHLFDCIFILRCDGISMRLIEMSAIELVMGCQTIAIQI